MTITSDLYTIEVSNLGRGLYCGGSGRPPNIDDSCRTTTFLSNNILDLTLYTSYGEDKEVFGTLKIAPKTEPESLTWVSIKYKDMAIRKLTDEERNELLSVVNSIQATTN